MPDIARLDTFAAELARNRAETFGTIDPDLDAVVARCCRLLLERIATSDMQYHNVEHTMLVTGVGQQILIGRHRTAADVTTTDWRLFTVALLCHDIGYVRGVCRVDAGNRFATGDGDGTVMFSDGSEDAALTPYHVSRSQCFVRENAAALGVEAQDVDTITSYIEMTRFPPPKTPEYQPTGTYAGLARAADFIGQMGDPNYLRKVPALFHEFAQVGANEKMGYRTPADMRNGYPDFFREVVNPYIQDALTYLRATTAGADWIENLQSHVREVEHGNS